MLSTILWVLCFIWFLAGILAYGINKHISTYAIFLGRQRGDATSPYAWNDDLLCVFNIFLGPIALLATIISIQELRGQAELTEIGLAWGIRPHLIGNEQLLCTITCAKSWGFRLSVPRECRQ